MRVLICGGRNFNDDGLMMDTMIDINIEFNGIDVIIDGDCRGADKLGGEWAEYMNIEREIYPANWNKYGKSAGYKRNTQMLVEGKPDLVVAFPGGKGTAMMIKIARDAGVEVREIT